MPRFEFKSENVKKNLFDFPKIRLKKNEIARVVLLEDPHGEYTHDLNKVKLVNGVPQTEIKKRRDGSEYEDYEYDFISRVICLGDFGTLESQGSDPKNCPICEEAVRSDMVRAPKRRFAMHIIKYTTKQGSADLMTPYGVQPVIWAFTDKVFEKLFAIKQEVDDLTKHDLILKCDNEPYQNYEITVSMKAEWRADNERGKTTLTAFKENRAEKIEVFCGSIVDKARAEIYLQQIKESYAIAEGTTNQSAADEKINTSLTQGIEDLLAETEDAPADDTAVVSSFDDLAADDDSLISSLSLGDDTEEESYEEPTEAEAATDDELDNLLNDLV